MIYECKVCGYRYDESKESVKYASLPSDWDCTVCGVGKDMFAAVEDASVKDTAASSAVQADSSGLKTASDVLAQTMANWGVRWVLGMVGHSNLGMAEAIRRCVDAGKMRYIGIRHEGAAAFACSAYGKLTAKPAACITIAGPGATNLITGLADAHLDRAPVIALTGQVPSKDMGLYAFQEIDLLSAFKEVAGSRQILQSGSDFGELMTTACRSAIANGDVSQIALPDDMQVLDANGSLPSKPDGALFSPPVLPPDSEISKAASMICAASRPVIIMGNGCRAAIGWVMELAEKLNCPVMTTYRAKGFVADSHPLACGVVGRSGTPVSAKFMSESDLIIGLGMGFSRHSEISKNKKILQIDRDPRAIGRLRRVDFGLVGDMAASLEKIVGQIYYAQSINMRGEIAAQWAAWREEKSRRAAKSLPGAISQAAVCAALSKYVEPTAIVSVDVGAKVHGFTGDCAGTYPCGEITPEAADLIAVTRQSFFEGIRYARPGCRISDIGHAIQEYVESHGYSVVRAYVGHGVGAELHEEPEIPNYGEPGHGPRLVKGMTLAIEPMVNQKHHSVITLPDGWTVKTADGGLSAHFEHTVAILPAGPEILTLGWEEPTCSL